MRSRVLDTIAALVEAACKRNQIAPTEIVKATISGNSTMIHLLLGLPAESIRLSPFVTAINHVPTLTARQVGLSIHPEATVDCLPGVASYVGADITAGVLSSGMDDTDKVTLFLDVGTNGETVLGTSDWLVTCACSAGPAFEGAGVRDGMRATRGAIEEVWINGDTYEPTFRVIGGVKPQGMCGSGLISLLAEMFLTGVIDKAATSTLTSIRRASARASMAPNTSSPGQPKPPPGRTSSSPASTSTTCCAPRPPSMPDSPSWRTASACRWRRSNRC